MMRNVCVVILATSSESGDRLGQRRAGSTGGVFHLCFEPVADDGVDPDAELDLRAERLRCVRALDLGL